jgi:hypothetical protein
MERQITSPHFCEYFRFKQNSHGYGTSGQATPPRFKTVCGGLCSAAHPNERVRRDSRATSPRVKPSPCGFRGGDRNDHRPPKTSFITSKSFSTKKSLPSAHCMMQPSVSLHICPGQPFRTCQTYGPCEPSRFDRGRGAVGPPRRKSHVSKMPPACLWHAAVILT